MYMERNPKERQHFISQSEGNGFGSQRNLIHFRGSPMRIEDHINSAFSHLLEICDDESSTNMLKII